MCQRGRRHDGSVGEFAPWSSSFPSQDAAANGVHVNGF